MTRATGIRIDDGTTATPEVNIADDERDAGRSNADAAVGVDQLKMGIPGGPYGYHDGSLRPYLFDNLDRDSGVPRITPNRQPAGNGGVTITDSRRWPVLQLETWWVIARETSDSHLAITAVTDRA